MDIGGLPNHRRSTLSAMHVAFGGRANFILQMPAVELSILVLLHHLTRKFPLILENRSDCICICVVQ